MGFALDGIPAEHIDHVRPVVDYVVKSVVDALEERDPEVFKDLDIEVVRQKLKNKELQLWLVINGPTLYAGIITQTYYKEIDGKRRHVMAVHAIAGKELRKWFPVAYDTLTRWAKACGCDRIEANCIPYTAKFMLASGFKVDEMKKGMTAVYKDISE